jgi:hypothetical protein
MVKTSDVSGKVVDLDPHGSGTRRATNMYPQKSKTVKNL